MPVSADTLRLLIAAGLEGEALIEVVSSIDEDGTAAPKVRSAHAMRQERYRKRKASQSVTRDASRDGNDVPAVSPKEIPPTPPKEITPSDIPPATPKGVSAPKPTPRSELVAVLSPLQADAVIAHRQRIGKPMTPHAAHLLAAKFAKCPNPDEAADAMVANGWQGFEPDWMDRQRARAGPSSKASPMDHFRNLASELNGQDRDDRRPSGNRDDAPGLPVRAIEHHRG